MIFPDVEMALIEFLGDLGYAVTATPFDLQDALVVRPVIRVQRVAGADDARAVLDYPNVIIQCYTLKDASNPRGCHDLSETVRDRLNAINDDGGVYIAVWNCYLAACQTISGPVELTYLDPAVSVFQTGHRLVTKGH